MSEQPTARPRGCEWKGYNGKRLLIRQAVWRFYIKDVPEDTQRAVQKIDELLDVKKKQKKSPQDF
jgi:hypothetical protein